MDELTQRRRKHERIDLEPAPQNTVFLVTQGENDDYRVVAAFSTYGLAEEFVDRWRGALRELGRIETIAVEGITVDEFLAPSGAFCVTVQAYLEAPVVCYYNPTGNPDAPADTRDAVELDGVPMQFTGYGATVEAARKSALALRESTITAEKSRG